MSDEVDVEISEEELSEALQRQLKIQELQRQIDELRAIDSGAQPKPEPLPEVVYTPPPSRRYALVDQLGRVVNVLEWAGPDVCDRCGAELGGADTCGTCGRVQWQPPAGHRMELAVDGGDVGDMHDGQRFSKPQRDPAPLPEPTQLERLIDTLVTDGKLTREQAEQVRGVRPTQ